MAMMTKATATSGSMAAAGAASTTTTKTRRSMKASSSVSFMSCFFCLASCLLLLFLLPLATVVNGEIIELDLLIDASSEEVHYIKGYLQAPGKIDLSALTFTSSLSLPDFMNGGEYDEDDLFVGEDDVFDEGDQSGGGGGGDGEGWDGDLGEDDDFEDNYPDLPPPPVVPPGSSQATRPPEDTEGGGGGGGDSTTTVAPTTTTPQQGEQEGGNDEGSSSSSSSSSSTEEEEGTVEPTSPSEESESSPTTTTTSEPAAPEATTPTTNSTTAGSGGGGDRDRRLKVTTMNISSNKKNVASSSTKQTRTLNEDGNDTPQSVVDIVLFMVTDDCRTDPWGGGCDWSTLGVGVPDEEMEGGVSYCCSQDTADRGLCTQDKVGTLIVDHTLLGKAHGEHRHIDVPVESGMEFTMKADDAVFEVTYSGNYIMVMANCYDYGMDVIASGDMVWQSVGGYLPGDMYGLMLFYGALACIYIAIAFWYYCGMRMFQDAAIPIQKFILATIILGLLEVSFRGLDLFYWNYDGKRSDGLMYVALTLGVLKRGISRCLAVMVAMGWGVVRDSLGRAYCQIVLLGLVYSGLTLARDYLILAAVEVEHINLTEEEELLDLALILTPLVIFVNVIFYFWIITSLNSTTEYLRNMNQASKLARHLRLRCLILSSLVVVGIWLMFSIVQVFTNTLSQDQVWILEAVMHVNYLYILVGVAILWRPNSHAKDYAMQMELSPDGDEDNELELSSNIPSAISDEDMDSYDDSYGNDPDHPNGVRVRNGVST